MLPTLVGIDLEKKEKFTKDESVDEEKETAESNEEKETAESKGDHVEEDQAYITSIKNKGDIVNTYITSIKIRITHLKKYTNQGLLQCLINQIKFLNEKNTQNP